MPFVSLSKKKHYLVILFSLLQSNLHQAIITSNLLRLDFTLNIYSPTLGIWSSSRDMANVEAHMLQVKPIAKLSFGLASLDNTPSSQRPGLVFIKFLTAKNCEKLTLAFKTSLCDKTIKKFWKKIKLNFDQIDLIKIHF